MNKRRLLETHGRRGLYQYDDEFGRALVWEDLEPPPLKDPVVQPRHLHSGFSLYPHDRSREVDRLLAAWEVR